MSELKKSKNKPDRIHILGTMPVNKAIIKLAVPTMIANTIQVVYNMTDTFFIGRVGEGAADMVGAISVCMPVFMILQSFGNIFSIGGASLISRLLGQGNRERANNAAAIAFWTALCVCSTLSILSLIFIDKIILLCGATGKVIEYARTYLFYMLIGAPFIGMQMALNGLLRSEGATNQSMIGMMTGSFLNMILDPIFIFTFSMGIAGAAIATTIGNIVGFSINISYYLRKKGIISLSLSNYRFDSSYFKSIFKIGIPASFGMILMSTGMLIGNSVAATVDPSNALVSANGIAHRITNVSFMLMMGLTQGCQPLLGFSYGAKKYKRLFSAVKFTIIFGTCMCTLFAVSFNLLADIWIRLFIDDPVIIKLGARIMRMVTYSMPVLAVQMTLMTVFQALGKTLQSLIISLGRQGLFFIPSIILFSKFWGLDGYIIAPFISDIFTTSLSVTLFLIMRKSMPHKIDENAEIDPEDLASLATEDNIT